MNRGRGGGRSRSGSVKKYPRTARLNESLREVIAEELEQIDDDRVYLVTITGIEVDPDLRHAVVFYSVMDPSAEERAAETQAALDEHRAFLQRAVARELTMKRTPLLSFRPDAGVANGARIERIISAMPRSPEDIDYGLDEEGIGGPAAVAVPFSRAEHAAANAEVDAPADGHEAGSDAGSDISSMD